MTTAEGWSYRVNIADIIHSGAEFSERSRRIALRLKASRWVQSLPEHEPVHRYIAELESEDMMQSVLAMQAIYDEATYHRVHIETDLVVPNPESL